MSDPYPIVEVQPEWVLVPEDMGSKMKFWYRHPGEQENHWLFKYPQPNTGQHWAEKIAAEIARLMGIVHARVELAEFQGERGSVTESFVRGGNQLYHGNQMLEEVVCGYSTEKKFRQSSHTLVNIWQVMDKVFVEPDGARRAKLCIAEYLILDALIGNTDRHHENWGILRQRVSGAKRDSVAPSFDHASSLGRELLDVRRDKLLIENRVGDYAEKGRGAIYWSEDERHGPSPLELVRRAACRFPDFFQPALTKLEKLDESAMSDLVKRVPVSWMASSAREFSVTLMRYNYKRLWEIFS